MTNESKVKAVYHEADIASGYRVVRFSGRDVKVYIVFSDASADAKNLGEGKTATAAWRDAHLNILAAKIAEQQAEKARDAGETKGGPTT